LDILEKVGSYEQFNSDLLFTKAAIFSQMGRAKEAIATLKSMIKLADPNELDEIYLGIAFEYQNLSSPEKAITYLRKALQIKPDNEEALYEMAYCYDQAELDLEAIETFQELLNENPYAFHAWYCLGNSYSKLGLHEQAEVAYDYATVIRDDFASGHFNKALSQANQGKYHEAIESLHEAKQYDLIDSISLYYIGDCYEKLEDFRQAERYYRQALERDPKMADALIGLVVALDQQGNSLESLHHARKALELEPDNADHWYVLAEICEKMGFIEESIEAYEMSLTSGYSDTDIWLDYSQLLFQQGLHEEVESVIHRAIQTHPGKSEIYYRFAAYLLQNGQVNDAEDMLSLALEIDPENQHQLWDYYPEARNFPQVIDLVNHYK